MHIFHRIHNPTEHNHFAHVALHLAFGVLFAGTLALVFGWAVMLLWNALMPEIFALPPLTYWQGVGLLLLGRILMGGIGHGHGRHGPFRRDRGRPWQEYDQWWKEAGEKSFREDPSGEGQTGEEKK